MTSTILKAVLSVLGFVLASIIGYKVNAYDNDIRALKIEEEVQNVSIAEIRATYQQSLKDIDRRLAGIESEIKRKR